jgi:hypothetical protein
MQLFHYGVCGDIINILTNSIIQPGSVMPN